MNTKMLAAFIERRILSVAVEETIQFSDPLNNLDLVNESVAQIQANMEGKIYTVENDEKLITVTRKS